MTKKPMESSRKNTAAYDLYAFFDNLWRASASYFLTAGMITAYAMDADASLLKALNGNTISQAMLCLFSVYLFFKALLQAIVDCMMDTGELIGVVKPGLSQLLSIWIVLCLTKGDGKGWAFFMAIGIIGRSITRIAQSKRGG